ncbi:hypothetical protein RB600_003479 [Gaeumannomyces tritici]
MVIHSWQDSAIRVAGRAWEVLEVNWHLGFTSFRGPPVHFKIVFLRHVCPQAQHQELFSISQALSGPGSTKMLYCINLIHDDTFSAVLAFLIWSLLGALGMFALSVGISNIQETLPRAVYALLSGLNSATVGIIALAAIELAQKAVTDKLTRLIVSVTGAAGLLYNALWYFPALVLASSCATAVHDLSWLHPAARAVGSVFARRWRPGGEEAGEHHPAGEEVPAGTSGTSGLSVAAISQAPLFPPRSREGITGPPPTAAPDEELRVIAQEYRLNMSWRTSAVLLGGFFAAFAAVMATRAAVPPRRPLLFSLFSNLFLAGAIIFSGGPAVIPLLREYVVAQGWVSPRDFLTGLAQVGFLDEGFESDRSLGEDPGWVVVAATSYVGGRYFGLAAPLAILIGAVLGLARYAVVSSP